MFDEKTILARLQNGEDAQKIADEMAVMINNANKAYAEQKAQAEKEAQAKAEAAAKKETAKNDLQDILDLFAEWFGKYYEIDVQEAKKELDAESVIELIDSLQELTVLTNGLKKKFSLPKTSTHLTSTRKSADSILNAFLEDMSW